MRTKKTFITCAFIFVGAFLVSFLAISSGNPVGESHAESGCPNAGAGAPPYSCEMEVSVNLDSVISITTSSIVVPIDITPTTAGVTGNNSVVVTVTTNHDSGYYLQMNTKTENTNLTQSGSSDYITSIAADTALASFAPNKWGYVVGADTTANFHQIPALSTPATIRNDIDHAPTTDAERQTTVTFGAKVDATIDTGVYKNTIVFTAYKND